MAIQYQTTCRSEVLPSKSQCGCLGAMEGWGLNHIPVLDFLTCGHQTQVHHENLSENGAPELSISVQKTAPD